MITSQKICGIDFPGQDRATHQVLGLVTDKENRMLVGKSILEDESRTYKRSIFSAPGGIVLPGEGVVPALDRWCEKYLHGYFPCDNELVAMLLFRHESNTELTATVLFVYKIYQPHWMNIVPDPTAYDTNYTQYMSGEELVAHSDVPGGDKYWVKRVLCGEKAVASFSTGKDFRQAALICGVHNVDSFEQDKTIVLV